MTRSFVEIALLICVAVFVASASAALLIAAAVKFGRRSWRRPRLLDTATVEELRSHQRTDAIEPSPGPAPMPDADSARRPGEATDAGGGNHP